VFCIESKQGAKISREEGNFSVGSALQHALIEKQDFCLSELTYPKEMERKRNLLVFELC
jgi:hypothetical protein